MVKLVGPAAEPADPGQLAEMAGLDAILNAGDLLIRGRFPKQSRHLGVGGGFYLVESMSFGCGHG